MEKKELELIDYLNALWKKKWLIVIGTFICVLIAGIVSFLLKPVYEIDTIIQPGKFFVVNEAGNFDQVIVEEPQQIADKIRHKSFDNLVAARLNMNVKEIQKIRAQHIEDTLLARILIRDHDVSRGKKVLSAVLDFIRSEIDEKIEIEYKNVDSEIETNEIDKQRRTEEIEILKKKLRIIDQRKKDIMEEMKSVRNRIGELEEEQMKVLKKEEKNEMESLGLLLYSNEIQQSLRYYDLLNEKLSEEKIKEEDVNSSLQNEYAAISKIETTILNLKERKGRIDQTKVIKQPTSTIEPVFPKKKLVVLVVGLLAFMSFSVLAFFMEYIDRKKTED